MQIIDGLEASKRGPYGGGIGHVGYGGTMDMCLALRTMVIPTAANDSMYQYGGGAGQAHSDRDGALAAPMSLPCWMAIPAAV